MPMPIFQPAKRRLSAPPGPENRRLRLRLPPRAAGGESAPFQDADSRRPTNPAGARAFLGADPGARYQGETGETVECGRSVRYDA